MLRRSPSAEEIESFRANGFIVIPEFLSANELEVWREKADAEARARPAEDRGRGYLASILSRDFSRDDADWARLTRDSRILRFAADLAGTTSLRVIAEQLSYCYPNYPATPWHSQQLEDVTVDDRRAVSAHIELDDSTVQGKCYVFLPGTHRDAPIGKCRLPTPAADPDRTFESIFAVMPQWQHVDPVAAECEAGSALFYYLSVVHGCGPNMTRSYRRYVGVSWAPSEATWNGRGTLAGESVSDMRPGDQFQDSHYPIVWAAPGKNASEGD
jgi:phytanoyl-CoA hydroxylase